MGRNGRGVKQASATSIEITFTYRGQRCRERIKLQPTAANLARAQRHREQILDSIADESFDYSKTFPNSKRALEFNPNATLTVEKWLDEWLNIKQPMLKNSTYTGYRKIICGQIIPALGNIKLIDIRRKDVRDWAASMTCTNKRISNLISPLRAALQDAMHDDLITDNPLYNWNYKRNEPPKKTDVDPFTREEQTAILNTLTGQAKNMIQFAFWTGLRTSEIIALEWGDIDWIKATAKIERAITQDSDDPETTKTKSGTREIKLLDPAMTALRQQKQYTFLEDKQIFMNPRTGQPWAGDAPIRKTLWTPALKKAGVRYRRPYQTRHTYASMMLSAGEPLAWLSRQMGHSSIAMTMRVYARWLPDENIDAGSRAVELFNEGEL